MASNTDIFPNSEWTTVNRKMAFKGAQKAVHTAESDSEPVLVLKNKALIKPAQQKVNAQVSNATTHRRETPQEYAARKAKEAAKRNSKREEAHKAYLARSAARRKRTENYKAFLERKAKREAKQKALEAEQQAHLDCTWEGLLTGKFRRTY